MPEPLLSIDEKLALQRWTLESFDFLMLSGAIEIPWSPSDAEYDALVGYYRAGLTSGDAAEALFAPRH